MSIESIVEDFEFLDDWDDRYKYLIELGNALEPMDEGQKNEQTKVQGCVSQVWVQSTVDHKNSTPVLHFKGDSDAHIVRGLVAITLALFSGKPASEILETDENDTFNKIGLAEHITPQRSNGLKSMVARIKQDAQAALQSA